MEILILVCTYDFIGSKFSVFFLKRKYEQGLQGFAKINIAKYGSPPHDYLNH